MRLIAKLIIGLAVLGFLNASYVTNLYVQQKFGNPLDSICDINDTLSCSRVITSEHALLFGIPTCTIALAVYVVLITLAILALRSKKNAADYFFAITTITAMGVMMNVIYIYNEARFIGAYCVMCIICGVIITTMSALGIAGYRLAR